MNIMYIMFLTLHLNHRVISMRDNKIKIQKPTETFNAVHYTLLKLDLSGDRNDPTNLQTLRK